MEKSIGLGSQFIFDQNLRFKSESIFIEKENDLKKLFQSNTIPVTHKHRTTQFIYFFLFLICEL